jgi:hypothetical protein
MSILKITTGNLRRTQAFDAELRSMSEIDKIANDFAEAILYQRDGRKRKPQIGKLVEKLAKLSEDSILPQAEKIGKQNAIDILSETPAPINLNDPVERAGALLRGRTRISTRLSIIRESIDASGGELNAALTRYWLEPSEGGDKAKLDRLRQIHERLEKRRKEYEKEMRDYSAGKIKQRPGKPDLDYMSEMVSESKKAIRQQARRAGTDAEISLFQARGHNDYIWVTPNGASACPDCRNRQSVVLTMAEWERRGRPGSGKTVCDVNCFCMLLPFEAAAAHHPALIAGEHTRIAGPLTSDEDLAAFNANRVRKN